MFAVPAVKLMALLKQTLEAGADVIEGTGLGLTVTVIVFAAPTQPAFELAVTEYTVVVVGLATTLVPVVALKFVFGVQL